jgi:hypothetical protein
MPILVLIIITRRWDWMISIMLTIPVRIVLRHSVFVVARMFNHNARRGDKYFRTKCSINATAPDECEGCDTESKNYSFAHIPFLLIATISTVMVSFDPNPDTNTRRCYVHRAWLYVSTTISDRFYIATSQGK